MAAALVLCLPAMGASEDDAEQQPVVFESIPTLFGEVLAADNIPVAMRDGETLSVDIYRPDDNDRHPTLYAAGPYPHTRDILTDNGSQVGPVAWYVNQGYNVAVVDIRGTGNSTGSFSFFDRDEQQDHYEVVEWIAEQAWSDGQVAGTGAGYYATSQWQLGIQNPPHLSCIAPINGSLNPFRDLVSPGGLASNALVNDWYDREIRLGNAYTPGIERIVDLDFRAVQLSHPSYDEFWRERSSLDSVRLVNVPVFAFHDWSLDRLTPDISGTVLAMAGLNPINKLLITNPGETTPLYQDTALLGRELLPFYQWCFNGRNASSPFIAQPRIRYQVRGQDSIKRESTWPPGNIEFESWFLNNGADAALGNLDQSRQSGPPGFSTLERRQRDSRMLYESAPLAEDLEIAGPIMLELFASSSLNDMAFDVILKEEIVYRTLTPSPLLPGIFLEDEEPELFQGTESFTEITVSHGSLKASMRRKNAALSKAYQPVYAQQDSEALVPGQVYQLDIGLRQSAYHFSAGSRIILEIIPVNDGALMDTRGRDMLHHNSQYPSRLWLPVVQRPALPSTRSAVQPAANTRENNTGGNLSLPDLRILDEETIDTLNGDEDNPVIFIPR